MSDRFEELERLARLLDEGKIDSQEYARLKQEIMGESGDIAPSVPTAPGWYNDPTGKATHQAYWDGDKWTGATRDGPTSSPAGIPPVASSQPGRSGCFWIVIAVIILIVLGAIGALVAVMVAGRTVTETFSDIVTPVEEASTCVPLDDGQLNALTGSWEGDGTLTVEATGRTPTSGGDTFTEIWYLQGSAPGVDHQIFVFATEPNGLLAGADSLTRQFFGWGADAEPDSPLAHEAQSALDAAPRCLD